MMHKNNSVKPEDILPDGKDTTIIDGKEIRKGTVAAFLANINILENPSSSVQHKQDAIDKLQELAPSVITVGLHHHVQFKNPQVEQILKDACS